MSDKGRDAMIATEPIPRIETVRPGPRPQTLVIAWQGGGGDTVDLSGLVARSRHFAALDDAALFETAAPVAYGGGVGWANGLDYAASNLRKMADEQRPMTGRQFAAWQKRMGLSNQETADLFGRALSTVKNYHKAKQVPMTVAATARSMMRDPVVFLSHYRPRPKAGRPRKRAAPVRPTSPSA